MDNITEKVYNFLKESVDKNGFPPSIRQIAKEFYIPDFEVTAAIEQLKESGRIRGTDIPRKTTIEFAD